MRDRYGIDRGAKMRSCLLFLALAFIPGCTSKGPLIISPDGPIKGVGSLLSDRNTNAQLNVLLVHGMRADVDQHHADIVAALSQRLSLAEVPDSSVEHPLLADDLPNLRFGDKLVWPTLQEWQQVVPRLRIQKFRHTATGTQVNFFILDYWRALTNLKCRHIVAADTKLIGASRVSEYCRANYSVQESANLAARPALGNRLIKTEIVEWGFADAVIVTSDFRKILREAVREALAIEVASALGAAGIADLTSLDEGSIRRQLSQRSDITFAVISRSLGSYVLLDAVRNGHAADDSPSLSVRDQQLRAFQRIAPALVVCNARQIHMLANQLPLLELSEFSLHSGEGAGALGETLNRCGEALMLNDNDRPPIEVVAYHEPNDLLTFYVEQPAVEGGGAPIRYSNVITSYAKVWIPGLLVNPGDAHAGQARDKRVMDLLAFGSQPE